MAFRVISYLILIFIDFMASTLRLASFSVKSVMKRVLAQVKGFLLCSFLK